ncbi:hypothetical protein KCP74_05715 [Salmonella enterica subsp. enterica]|nr:hypothetical protein KCP74_05715 [Salmonella enterica subsp. enterica]
MACWMQCWRWPKPYSARHETSLSYWGMVAAHSRAGGDDYRHRLQPNYSTCKGVTCEDGRATA